MFKKQLFHDEIYRHNTTPKLDMANWTRHRRIQSPNIMRILNLCIIRFYLHIKWILHKIFYITTAHTASFMA